MKSLFCGVCRTWWPAATEHCPCPKCGRKPISPISTPEGHTPSERSMRLASDYITAKRNNDEVTSPAHYTKGGIETIDYIEAKLSAEQFIGYLCGNILKYQSRWQEKGGVKDLRKAQFYLNLLLERKKVQ